MENRTPAEKIGLACKLMGLDPAAYTHLDNGRKSMTAGNLLRGWLKKEADAAGRLQAECGLSDVEVDAYVAPEAKPRAARPVAETKVSSTLPIPELNWVEAKPEYAGDGSRIVRMSPDAIFSADVIGA